MLNCNGFLCPEHFASEGLIAYRTLWLQDTTSEDITSILYEAFDFIGAAREAGGNVLVHCSQGVSRSAAVAIAYLMWRGGGKAYDAVCGAVKAARAVVAPNIGFMAQLMTWHKSRLVPQLQPGAAGAGAGAGAGVGLPTASPHSPWGRGHGAGGSERDRERDRERERDNDWRRKNR